MASIASKWITDSEKAMRLGLLDLQRGHPHTMNRAMSFADLYNMEGKTTLFFKRDNAGTLTTCEIPISLNADGRVRTLLIGDSTWTVEREPDGRVISVEVTPC